MRECQALHTIYKKWAGQTTKKETNKLRAQNIICPSPRKNFASEASNFSIKKGHECSKFANQNLPRKHVKHLTAILLTKIQLINSYNMAKLNGATNMNDAIMNTLINKLLNANRRSLHDTPLVDLEQFQWGPATFLKDHIDSWLSDYLVD